MSINRTVVGIFANPHQAAKSLKKVEANRLANSEISLVYKKQDEFKEETASEIYPIPALEGVIISSGNISIPDVGNFIAAGPLGGILQKKPETGISRALIDYGLSDERSDFYANQVKNGKTLVVIKTNNDKINELANVLQSYGADYVEKHKKR